MDGRPIQVTRLQLCFASFLCLQLQTFLSLAVHACAGMQSMLLSATTQAPLTTMEIKADALEGKTATRLCKVAA
jgi:hypothetical protein